MFLRRFKTVYARSLYETLKSEETAFDKQIKFYDFCKHMAKLEKMYEDDQRTEFLRLEKLKRLALSGKEPVRDILSFYFTSRKDYDSKLIVDCLEYLGKIISTKGFPAYSDLSVLELSENWQFQSLLKDLHLGLEGKEFLPPIHLAQISIALADIGYKDTELFGKIIESAKRQTVDPQNPSARGIYKHHIYSGFQDHEEFKNHVATLLE